MLSEICFWLKNWFCEKQPRYIGEFEIADGKLDIEDKIATDQYYRIVGSVFNDGVYKRGGETLVDERFEGAVWLMAIPKDFLDLVGEIEAWQDKYGGVGSTNMSPYQSENFAGTYSYTKSSDASASLKGWQGAFANRLGRYRKV
jgi:hypothetical protein